MKTAQFEFRLTQNIQAILDAKQAKWELSRKESVERIKELSEVFAGTKVFPWP